MGKKSADAASPFPDCLAAIIVGDISDGDMFINVTIAATTNEAADNAKLRRQP
jgi:hypothetical protein